nr:MAG TPA: protein of unknown function (DUF5618) [Caudoviricetes sp.]
MIAPHDFWEFARNMPRENETDDRVCIGRAYYAAMHASLAYAVSEGYTYDPKEAGGTHGNLIFYFERKDGDAGQEVADLLRKLKRARERADYRLDESVFSADAVRALRQAQDVFALVSK